MLQIYTKNIKFIRLLANSSVALGLEQKAKNKEQRFNTELSQLKDKKLYKETNIRKKIKDSSLIVNKLIAIKIL